MSSNATPVTARHLEYLAERTQLEDAFLRELRAAAEAAGIPAIQISPEQASFLQILLRGSGARRVVEVGTLAGYSAIAMARALPEDGLVETIEYDPERARFAQEWADRSDVAGKVRVRPGTGEEVLKTFAGDSADAIFIDADKASYPAYLEEGLRVVRIGGWILVDNAFAFGQLFDEQPSEPGVEAVRAFNDLVPRYFDRLQAIITPIGDGCWVGVRTR